MAIREIAHEIRGGTYRSPKTILGFFAIVVGLVLAAVVTTVAVLARAESLHALIPWILGFAAILVVVVLAGIFFTAWKDPTVLMLGQITGHDYIENRKLTLGDSIAGEYIEDVVQSSELVRGRGGQLPQPKSDEGGTA